MPNIEISKPTTTPPARTHHVFDALRDEMDRVFERFEQGWQRWPSLFRGGNGAETMMANLDVHEDAKSVMIEADLPGVEEKDLSVTLANGILTIKGEKKHEREEKKEDYYLCERSFGSFARSVRLPDTIDESKVDARFDKGVLKVTAAKRPEAVKAEKKIEIKKG
ncbi:MAG TPA: Hsp20/alpha crystallin family protein [Hyphomicrobiaceae bacterium]|nr:Hsp20/alpha crystallin family protein [Hyphomicrobiaceae bacterium]